MSRKDYERLATIISNIKNPEERKEIARLVADMCKEENIRFNRDLFYTACKL